MNEQQLRELYGLARYPFEIRELDPQKYPQETELPLYARIEGFGRQAPDIDRWFAQPGRIQDRSFILVYGPKQCGRSSVANYVYHRFVEALQQSGGSTSRLLRRRARDNDRLQPIQELLQDLFYILEDLNELAAGTSKLELRQRYMTYVIDGTEDGTLGSFADIFRRSRRLLENPHQQVLAVLLDNVRSEAQMDAASQVFTDIPLLLFTTSATELYESYRNAQPPHLAIELSELELEDIKQFLTDRWSVLTGGGAPHPFPDNGLAAMCPEKTTLPFMGVVQVLNKVFSEHLEAIEAGPAVQAGPPIRDGDMAVRASRYLREYGYIGRMGGGE